MSTYSLPSISGLFQRLRERIHCARTEVGSFSPIEKSSSVAQCLIIRDEEVDPEFRPHPFSRKEIETIRRYPYRNPLAVFNKFGCHFRLKFDPIKGGRCHGCRYCYRQQFIPEEKLVRTTYYANPNVLLDALIEMNFRRIEHTQAHRLLLRRTPIRLGSMCDPFAPDRHKMIGQPGSLLPVRSAQVKDKFVIGSFALGLRARERKEEVDRLGIISLEQR